MSKGLPVTTELPECLLILGPPSLRHVPAETHCLAIAPLGRVTPLAHHTVVLGHSLVTPLLPFQVHHLDGSLNDGVAKWGELITGSARLTDRMTPLFLVAGHAETGWRPYSQIEVSGGEVLFIALDGEVVRGDPTDTTTLFNWLEELGVRHRQHAPQLNNHQRWFINAAPGTEIEQKFTLAGQPDIWRLALTIRDLVAQGDLTGWMPEHRNDFEQWSFPTHLYEVPGADGERGDLAFIPAVDGRWIIRRKWYDVDAAIRREELTDGVTLPADVDFVAVATERFGVAVIPVGTYRRVRYNVMLESLGTGHVFSIMFDECSADDAGDVLHQVEVEYIRSRTLARTSAYAEVMTEFESLNMWTRLFLEAHDVAFVEDHLSKLSWLKGLKRRDKIP